MIIAYLATERGIQPTAVTAKNPDLLNQAVWIDLLSPTDEESHLTESKLNLTLPSRKDMQSIELSSRLYEENACLVMTVTMVAKSDTPFSVSDGVTFLLSSTQLITIRYIEPQSFLQFIAKANRLEKDKLNAENLLITVLECSADRLADILENLAHRFDLLSQHLFQEQPPEDFLVKGKVNYRAILNEIGANSNLGAQISESLLSFERLGYFLLGSHREKFSVEFRNRLKVIRKDIHSLSDYSSFISTKVNFLLDATLGMINIEQNTIIKAFSIAAVIFLPPTLIASIYGMNFEHMPELKWLVGYPCALFFMGLSAWIPYRYFKKNKWL